MPKRVDRYFEFHKGRSQKYWLVRVDSPLLMVQYGRIGTLGKRTWKDCGELATALKMAERLIREKLEKGYREPKGRAARQLAEKVRTQANHLENVRALEALRPELDKDPAAAARRRKEWFESLPRRVSRALDWDELEAIVLPDRHKIERKPSRLRVSGLRTPPPTYVEFVTRFAGEGEWGLVYQKKDWPLYFNLTPTKRIGKELRDLRTTYKREEPELLAKWRSLVPFASNASDTYFCWDAKAVDQRGEPPIYTAEFKRSDPDGYAVRKLGKDLLEVIRHYRPGANPPP